MEELENYLIKTPWADPPPFDQTTHTRIDMETFWTTPQDISLLTETEMPRLEVREIEDTIKSYKPQIDIPAGLFLIAFTLPIVKYFRRKGSLNL